MCHSHQTAPYRINLIKLQFLRKDSKEIEYMLANGTNIDVLPSKNQVLWEYFTHINKLKHC